MKVTKNTYEKDGKGKIELELELKDRRFKVVKLYEGIEYEQALKDAQEELNKQIKKELPELVDTKIKYLLEDADLKEEN